MNGTPANLTVWQCDYSFQKPPRAGKLPSSAKKENDKVENRVIIASSDPSGKDCFEIARRLVLGANPYTGSDFRLLVCVRMLEVMGLVGVTTWDKLEGKAPEKIGVETEPESDSNDDGNEGGSVPPSAALN